MLSTGLWVLTGLIVALWGLVYLWSQDMACAYVTNGTWGNCGIRKPWSMAREELIHLVLIPASVVGALGLAAWKSGRHQPRGIGLLLVLALLIPMVFWLPLLGLF